VTKLFVNWKHIWHLYKEGKNSTDIAKEFGSKPSTICSGLTRRGYKLRPQRISILRGKRPFSRKEQCQRYYAKHKDNIKEKRRNAYWQNPDKFREKTRNALGKHPPKNIKTKKCSFCRKLLVFNMFSKKRSGKYLLRARCKKCECLAARKYRMLHPEKVRESWLSYRRNTPIEKLREIRNKSAAKSMRRPEVKLRSYLRKRLIEILKSKGIRKSPEESALKLVGCSIGVLRKHLERQFTKGMSWDNWGVQKTEGEKKWHVHHIKEVQSFNLSNFSERRECFNYKNLKPLWAIENIKMSKKYYTKDIEKTGLDVAKNTS
jgi:hypothetical protein